MDPVTAVGVAAAALQLSEQAINISDSLYQYFKSVKNAPAKSRELRLEALLLSDVLETLADVFSAQSASNVSPKAGKYGDMLKEFSETAAEMVKKVELKKGKLSIQRLQWPFTEKENEKYLAILERFKSSFQLALQALNSSKLDDIQDIALRIDNTVTQIHQLNMDAAERQRQETRVVILNWIFPGEFANRHKEITRVHSKGSGDWFVNSSIYQTWLKGDVEVLFCHGMPGSGKSVIMSRVVDDVTYGPIAYIYFDYNDPKSFEPETIVRSLLKQLLFNLATVPDGVEEHYNACTSKGKAADTMTLKQQLLLTIAKIDRVFLLFDALDEISSEYSKEVMSLIADISKAGPKIFCTSRINTARVRDELGNPVVTEIRANVDDIVHYINGRLDKEYDYDDESKQKIADCLVQKADGKFLLVRFQLDYVLDFAEPSESLEALSIVPTDMEEAYKLLLKRIEKRRRPTVVKILSWLFRARRPLKQDEIREAIAVRLGARMLSKPLLHLHSLIQYCQGLVSMDETTEIVRFSHFTVKEFLIMHFEDQLLSPIDCARLCLTYVNFEIFEKGPCSNKGQYTKRTNEYRFSVYVALFWGAYTKGPAEEDEQVVDTLWTFFESRKKRAALRQIQRIQNPSEGRKIFKLSERHLNVWTLLHTVAHEGLATFYQKYMSSQNPSDVREASLHIELGNVHSENEEMETSLLLASGQGHSAVVNLLIANGADVMAKNSRLETPLHKAAAEGHIETAKLLIEMGAEINAVDNQNWTPLHKAATGGHDRVVALLLDKGAEVNIQDNYEWTPLHRAASGGHYHVVKSLLNRGADINVPNEYNWNPLLDAANGGHFEVVKLLLRRAPDLVNAKDTSGWTPLYEAANGGHLAVVKLLVAKSSGINTKDDDGNTPLHRAAGAGHDHVVYFLLENGAEINAREKLDGMTPLHRAVLGGHHNVSTLLHEKGAEIDAKDRGGQTPLHKAASTGDHEMVKLLLEWGANPFAKDHQLGSGSFYPTARLPLHEAAVRARGVLNSLLDEGAAKNEFRWIPLESSSWWNYVTVISQLCKAAHATTETLDCGLHSEVESAFTHLAAAFAGDDVFWRILGHGLLRKQMFREAIYAYDMFVRKFVFQEDHVYDPSARRFVSVFKIKARSNIESIDFGVHCHKCADMIRGYHYKCKKCNWDINYCQVCVQEDWNDCGHSAGDLFHIPSHWPVTQPDPKIEMETTEEN